MSGVPQEPPPGLTKPDLTDLGTADANTILGGTAWSTISVLVPPIQTLVVSVVASRFLGTEGFGQQSLIAFVSISCTYVLAARMPAALSRFGAQLAGAREPAMLHDFYRRTVRSQIVVGALLLLAFAVLAAAGADPSAAWILAGFSTFAAVVQGAPANLLSATQRWRDNVVPGTITTTVASVVMIVVLAAGGGVAGYFAIDVAMVLANLFWTWRLARRISTRLPDPIPVKPAMRAEFKTFIRASTFFAVVEFVVLNRSEILFLDHFSTAAQVGFYSVAFAASEAVARFPAILTTVALPAVANLHGAGEHERIRNGYWRAIRLLGAVCPPLVVTAAIFGTDLIGLVYGAKFTPAEPVVVILLLPYLVLPMAGLSDALLWTFGRIRFLVLSGIAATVVDIVAALILVPRYDAIGAAIASDLGALTAGIPALWLVVRLMRPIHVGGRLARNHLLLTLACGICAAVPVVFLGGVPGLVVGIPVTAAAVWFIGGRLGLLDRGDGAWLDDATGHRLGGRIRSLIRHFSVPGPDRA